MALPPFENLAKSNHIKNCPSLFPPNCLICQLCKLSDGIHSGKYSKFSSIFDINKKLTENENEQKGIDVSMFKSCLCIDNPMFLSHSQQDALELLVYFIFKMETSNFNEELDVSINIQKLLNCKFSTRFQCQKCKSSRFNKEPSDFLSLPLNILKEKKENDLMNCFEKFFEDEIIDDFKCDHCNEKTAVSKLSRINEFPKLLILQLQRFVFYKEKGVICKNDCPVNVPEQIDLTKFKQMDTNANAKTNEQSIDQNNIDSLMSMGFNKDKVTKVLKITNNDLEKALNLMLSVGDGFLEENNAINEFKIGGKYQLFGFVTHIGNSTQQGHYIAHILKNDKWVCFNDRKVFQSDLRAAKRAYILFYMSKDWK
ncbi:Ubiquitin carboxyl-terminal hydrolase 5 [Bonamia ostreae]|uniref:Ubiquitin carboxyl-terminal hydrolase 5 n=1 Tax=Bonamia ostreae TaxID=126728 RepID=A0ABV2AN34_9EUKA